VHQHRVGGYPGTNLDRLPHQRARGGTVGGIQDELCHHPHQRAPALGSLSSRALTAPHYAPGRRGETNLCTCFLRFYSVYHSSPPCHFTSLTIVFSRRRLIPCFCSGALLPLLFAQFRMLSASIARLGGLIRRRCRSLLSSPVALTRSAYL
jgi:hypothetical protein